MKKISLFLLFLMALVVMSCSKDETSMSISQESAIEFATYVGAMHRRVQVLLI